MNRKELFGGENATDPLIARTGKSKPVTQVKRVEEVIPEETNEVVIKVSKRFYIPEYLVKKTFNTKKPIRKGLNLYQTNHKFVIVEYNTYGNDYKYRDTYGDFQYFSEDELSTHGVLEELNKEC